MSRFRDMLRQEAEEDGDVPNVVEKVGGKPKKLKKKDGPGKVSVELAPALDDEIAPASPSHFKEAVLSEHKTRAVELGVDYWETEEQVKLLKEKLAIISRELFPLVKALGGEDQEIVLPDGKRVVVTTTGGGRRATMASIVAEFGEPGKAFWKAIEPAPGYERLEGRGPRDEPKKTSRKPKPRSKP